MVRKKNNKNEDRDSNSNLPQSILDELEKDNISFSDHIYREKYTSIESEEEGTNISHNADQLKVMIESEEASGNSEKAKLLREILNQMKDSENKNLTIDEQRFNWEQKEAERVRKLEKESVNKELYEEHSLKNLIAKHDGNEDGAMNEFKEFMISQGHDEEDTKKIMIDQAKEIDRERKSEKKDQKTATRANRKEEISNMAAHEQAFAHFNDVYSKTIGKGLGWAGNKIGYVLGWVLLILIISLSIFAVTFSIYKANAEECAELQNSEMNAWGKVFAIWGYSEFSRCVRTNFNAGVVTFVKNINIFKPIWKIFNQQVNIATGGLYYAQVDENAREPTGLFIKNIEKQEKYYSDEPLTVSATVEIKTINSKIVGSINGYLNGQACNKVLYPTGGVIAVDQDTSERFICTYKENTLDKSDTYPFQIISTFQTKNIAYMRPTFIKRTVWDQYTTAQKNELKNSAKSNSLKDSNSPMRIGGHVGATEDGIVSVNDYSEEIKTTTFPLSITLQSGEQNNGWTNGKVKKINQLIIVIPQGLKLKPDEEGINPNENFMACQGYTFKKESGCSNLDIDDDSYSEFLCGEDDVVYSIVQNDDTRYIKSFESHETIYCLVEADSDDLFKNQDGNNLGKVDDKGIKIYSDYKYNVEKIMKLNLVKRYNTQKDGLVKYECSDKTKEELFDISNEVVDDTKKAYYTKYQSNYKSMIDKVNDKNNEDIEYEALMAAITEKYNQFKLKNVIMSITQINSPVGSTNLPQQQINSGDFLNGCLLIGQKIVSDDEKLETECLINRLKTIKKYESDPEIILTAYYENTKRIDETNKLVEVYDNKATVNDYNLWRYSLCDKTDWEADEEEEAVKEEVVV